MLFQENQENSENSYNPLLSRGLWLARLEGFEPPTPGIETLCSIQAELQARVRSWAGKLGINRGTGFPNLGVGCKPKIAVQSQGKYPSRGVGKGQSAEGFHVLV